jgi:hypothetical protein
MQQIKDVDLVDEVEIELFAKRGERPPQARRYVIRIDKERKTVTSSSLTGREILGLVDKTPETHKLYQHIRGEQPRAVAPDESVDFRAPGVERFTTMPRDTTEGAAAPSVAREFVLPEFDRDALDGLGRPWETLMDGGTMWLILHDYEVPLGYNHTVVEAALLIPPSYPDGQIDMVYFYPALHRTDGRPIPALADQPIRGEIWQRWSRHRTGANPWRPSVDDVASHLILVDDWLRRELERA